MKKGMKKLLSIILVLAMLLSMAAAPAMADGKDPIVYKSKNGKYVAEKISNPTKSSGEADGLVDDATQVLSNPENLDEWARQNSYSWSMTELKDKHGDYLYIGTNRNLVYQMMFQVWTSFGGSATPDSLKALKLIINNGTGGEIYTYEDPAALAQLFDAVIVRYDINNKTFEVWNHLPKKPGTDEPLKIIGFRAAQTFDGKVFFNVQYDKGSCVLAIDGNDAESANWIVEPANGLNIRAMALSEDKNRLYIGGSYNTNGNGVVDAQGNQLHLTLYALGKGSDELKVIGETPESGESVFALYEKDSKYHTAGGDVWDIAEFQGDVYFALMTHLGAMVFKGEENGDGKWTWSELAGDSEDSPYPAGFGDKNNYALTPYVFNGDLYFLSFANIFDSTMALTSILTATDDTNLLNKACNAFGPILTTLKTQTSVFRLTSDGHMQMVVGDENDVPEGMEYKAVLGSGFNNDELGTTLYNWRASVYKGKLYIGTFDSYSLYKYFTQLTNGTFFGMNSKVVQDDFKFVIEFLKEYLASRRPLNLLAASAKNQEEQPNENDSSIQLTLAAYNEYESSLEQKDEEINESIPSLKAVPNEEARPTLFAEDEFEFVKNILALLQANSPAEITEELIKNIDENLDFIISCLGNIERVLTIVSDFADSQYKEAVVKTLNYIKYAKEFFEDIDPDAVKTYLTVSEVISKHEDAGFELYCTADGVNYETVTLNGFNDEYNYGCRTLFTTDDGLYLGTANPFYGTQLWRIREVQKKPTPSSGGSVNPAPVVPKPGYLTCTKDSTCPLAAYNDLTTTGWYHDGIHYCLEKGYMNGIKTNEFAPLGTTTRAQVVTILWRIAGSPVVNYSMTFKDVTKDWYREAVRWAASEKIVEGFNVSTFGPSVAITREQLATILCKFAKYNGEDVAKATENTNTLSYEDIFTVSDWATEGVHWCLASKIIAGNNGKVLPLDNATRAEVATMIQRFCTRK